MTSVGPVKSVSVSNFPIRFFPFCVKDVVQLHALTENKYAYGKLLALL